MSIGEDTLVTGVAADEGGTAVALARRSGRILTFDLLHNRRLSTFDSPYQFVGGGVVLPTSEICVAGGSQRGVRAYCATTGQELWRRSDLESIFLRSARGKLWISDRSQTHYEVDIQTGRTLDSLADLSEFYPSQVSWAELVVLIADRKKYLVRGLYSYRIDPCSYGILDVSFSPTLVFLSEAGGPLRALDLSFGVEVGRYTSPAGWHVLWLHYQPEPEVVYAVDFNYNNNRKVLLRLSTDLSQRVKVCELDQEAVTLAFAPKARKLITSVGSVFDLDSGSLLYELPIRD